MFLNISNLIEDKDKIIEFHFLYKKNEIPILDKSIIFADKMSFPGNIKKYKNNFLLTGILNTTILLECVSCLKKFEYKIKEKIMINYIRKYSDTEENKEPNINTNYFEGFTINISEDIRQWIILNTPFYPKCSNDCLGLCQSCGVDLNYEKCKCIEDKKKDYGILNDIIDKLSFN